MSLRGAGAIPDDHSLADCDHLGCVHPYHTDEYGFCLGCGGCGDPECCQHDESCAFEDRP